MLPIPRLDWRSDPPRMLFNRDTHSTSFNSKVPWLRRPNHLAGDHVFSSGGMDRADVSQDAVSG
jgi:hypothetical protein